MSVTTREVKLAAIDIGSNAIRIQISKITYFQQKKILKKLEYIRFPLRLGSDVFQQGFIGPVLEEKFIRLMQAFKIIADLYEVEAYRACATSAFREATNGDQIVQKVHDLMGLKIDIIDGEQEAELISSAIVKFLDEKPYLHIDVGGGSTELNLYKNKIKAASVSLNMGSVRIMNRYGKPETWVRIEEWVRTHVTADFIPLTAIGTGGNISKLLELSQRESKKSKFLSIGQMQQTMSEIEAMSLEDRVSALMLNPDRADVILPAAQIYMHVMRYAKAKKIMVPDVGLKDGIIEQLSQQFSY